VKPKLDLDEDEEESLIFEDGGAQSAANQSNMKSDNSFDV